MTPKDCELAAILGALALYGNDDEASVAMGRRWADTPESAARKFLETARA